MPNPIQPLSEAELERLEQLLEALHAGKAMTLPEIDGYFCALACGPNREPMPARLNHILGFDFSIDLPMYDLQKESSEASKLLTRQFESISAAFRSGEPYLPRFDQDMQGRPSGIDWAAGFVRGMKRDAFLWDNFMREKKNATMMTLLGILVAEGNPDLLPGGIGPLIPLDRRIELLAGIVACLHHFSQHFHPSGKLAHPWNAAEFIDDFMPSSMRRSLASKPK